MTGAVMFEIGARLFMRRIAEQIQLGASVFLVPGGVVEVFEGHVTVEGHGRLWLGVPDGHYRVVPGIHDEVDLVRVEQAATGGWTRRFAT